MSETLPPIASSNSEEQEFEDVEEIQLGEDMDEKSSTFREQLRRVVDLVRRGNQAFRENRLQLLEEAISLYTKARILEEYEPIILSNRSAALSRFSQQLRNRSASISEFQPLNGLDPTTYAEVALKDAEKVLTLKASSTKAFYQKAKSLILLERYEEARETILQGLQVDPLCIPLQRTMQNLEKSIGGYTRRVGSKGSQRTDDFDCTLCLKLLYEPVTTPCGHSFCRACLLQAMDHGNKCPMCRTVLFLSPRAYPVSVTLKNIIEKNFPEEYAERKSEHASLTSGGVDFMPLFVMDVVLPGQKMALNIFEPRYRLMVRRIMEGNRRMGMVAINPSTGSLADVACEVEICECEPLPDGRFSLEVVGRRRFRIIRAWDQDGYRVAEVEWIHDISPSDTAEEREEMHSLVRKAADLVCSWINEARQVRTDRSMRGSSIQAELMSQVEHPERFSFWLVNLLNLRLSEKLEILRLQDTRERISRALVYLRSEEQCRVQ